MTKEVCPTCGHDQFMIIRNMTSRRVGKCGHEWECPKEPEYRTDCGSTIKEAHRSHHESVCEACKKIAELTAENDRLFKAGIDAAIEHPCYELSRKLEAENNELLRALNRIAILGSGDKAYTKDFTTEVMGIARGVLEGK